MSTKPPNPNDFLPFTQAANFFNASYSFLLLSIEVIWENAPGKERHGLARNIQVAMKSILGPLAAYICNTPIIGEPDKRAGPTFEMWDFETNDQSKYTALDQLKAMRDAMPEDLKKDTFLVDMWTWVDQLHPLPSPPVSASTGVTTAPNV